MKMYEVSVEENDSGEICIIQPVFGGDDSIIFLSPDQIDILCSWLTKSKQEFIYPKQARTIDPTPEKRS